MHRPYRYTLTQADRMLFQKCLMGTSAFCGVVTLLVIGIAFVSHDRSSTTQNETAAVVRSAARDDCPDQPNRDTRLVRKPAGTGGDGAFAGCI